jgi:hypothetical protein
VDILLGEYLVLTRTGFLVLSALVLLLGTANVARPEGVFESALKEELIAKVMSTPGYAIEIPADVLDRFASCVASFAVQGLTQDELAEMDEAVSTGTDPRESLDRKVKARMDEMGHEVQQSGYTLLASVCPIDVETFKQYRF